MIFVKGLRITKSWGIRHLTPNGPRIIRNPPREAFTIPTERDVPAFAHDGESVIPGEWEVDERGVSHYNTAAGTYQHGIDAAATRLGWFLKKHGIDGNPVEIINKAIQKFNHSHTSHQDIDDKSDGEHSLPEFNNMAWRKVRAGMLGKGDSTDSTSERATRTQNGTLVTAYTNKNFTPGDKNYTHNGRFIESYSIPFNDELGQVLEKEYGVSRKDSNDLSFIQKPYIYAHQTAPEKTVSSSYQEHNEQVTPEHMSRAPEGYFSGQTAAHTESTTHHLPDIFFYPSTKESGQKKGSGGSWDHANGIYQAAEKAITEAASNIDAIPDVPATINMGTLGSPEMIQRPLREIIQDPIMRKKLIEDMSNVPAMMYLFGRPGQGDFKKHFDNLMGLYGADDESLSVDEHNQYFKPGRGGSKGKDTTASRIMGLAHKSGVSEDDPERSNLSNHKIDSEQLEAFGVRYSEGLLGQVDRFRGIIEALADHQAEAQGFPVKMAIGDINTEAMQGMQYVGHPGENEYTELDEHMDPYMYNLDDMRRTSAMPIHTDELPQGEGMPPPAESPVGDTSISPPSPIHGGTPRPPYRHEVGVKPQSPAARPLQADFQQVRPAIGQLSPQRFREVLHAGGEGRRTPAPSPELTPLETRAQQGLSDPHQQLLDQWMKAEDAHLPVMDRVMKALENMQLQDADMDNLQKSNLNNAYDIAKYIGLTASEVISINQTMGDWYNIAKSYSIEPQMVKIIKTNMR